MRTLNTGRNIGRNLCVETGHETVLILARGTNRQDAGTLQAVLLLPACRGVGIAVVPVLPDVSFLLIYTALFAGSSEMQNHGFF